MLGEILRGFQWIYSKIVGNSSKELVDAAESNKISRSEFITKTALVLGATHVGAMTFGIISGAHDYRVRRKCSLLAASRSD